MGNVVGKELWPRLSSAPGSPVEGQVYYNTTDDKFYGYANGAWVDLGAAGGGMTTSQKAFFGMTRFEVYGHSLAAGGGASDPDKDALTKLASMFGGGTLEINRSVGGAIACWHNIDPFGSVGNGGYQTVLQGHKTKRRPHAKLTAAATGGSSSTLTVGTVTDGAFTIGQIIHFGLGSTSETRTITNVAGSVLTLNAVVTNNKAIGDPVYEVPHAYEAMSPLYITWYGNNDFPTIGLGDQTNVGSNGGVGDGKAAITNAVRTIITKVLSAEVYDANHTSLTPGGGLAAAAAAGAGLVEGTHVFGALAVNNTVTWQIPANFKGGNVSMTVATAHNSGSTTRGGIVASFTVDGVASGTLDTRIGAYKQGATVKYNAHTKRFTGLSAGPHTIVMTVTAASGLNYWDFAAIEATKPPLVLVPSPIRTFNYSLWPNWEYTEIKGTVNANHGTGVSSFTITAGTNPAAGTQIMKALEYITFDPGGANEETLVINADVAAGGTTVTTTTTSTKAHNTGQAYRAQTHDQAITLAKQWYIDLVAEFPSSVMYVDVDTVLNKQAENFSYDGAHPTDVGHSLVAKAFFEAVQNAAALDNDLISRLTIPTAPLPGTIYIVGPLATAGAGAAPGAANVVADAFPNSHQTVDLRRARYARVMANVTSLAPVGGIGKIEYLAQDATWKTLGRKQTNANTANNLTTEPGTLNIGTTGVKTGISEWGFTDGWFYLPAEVNLMRTTELRYVHGNRTSGTNIPTYAYIAVQFL